MKRTQWLTPEEEETLRQARKIETEEAIRKQTLFWCQVCQLWHYGRVCRPNH